MKKIFYIASLSALLLAACGDAETTNEPNDAVEVEETTDSAQPVNWQADIQAIASNADAAADKFYALEQYMIAYTVSDDEVEQFTNDIIADYESGSYLSELDNHERMLTNIFKAHIVETNASGATKDFAFDYLQNLKYTYRGVDAVDSEAVKSNENQMNKALADIK